MRFLKAQYNWRTMYLNSFGFPQQILDDESLEAGHVPEVDEGDAEQGDEEEGVGRAEEVLEAVGLDVGGDEDPRQEGRDVHPRVDPELERGLVHALQQVQEPRLVEHRVQLRHEAEHPETLANVRVQHACEQRTIFFKYMN